MTYLPNPDAPQFFSGDACKAAGIDGATLKNWIVRDPPVILTTDEDRAAFAAAYAQDEHAIGPEGPSHERMATGSGRSHLFTWRRVMQIALTAELVRLGLPPRKAGIVAAGFTDVGDGAGQWGDGPVKFDRLPGEMYPSGLTVLVTSPDTDTGRVVNVGGKSSLAEVFFHGTRRAAAVALVNVNEINDRVANALGLDRGMFRTRPTK